MNPEITEEMLLAIVAASPAASAEALGALRAARDGNATATIVQVGEVVRIPLLAGGVACILVHNHPSGDPSPSPEDIAITRQVAEAAKLIDLELLDHLIIGHGTRVSMRERRLLL